MRQLPAQRRPVDAGGRRRQGITPRGSATAARPGSPAGPVRLGARGFAALYAGIPMATLRRAGLAAGGDASADDALDSAFAGQAFMLDGF